MKSLQDLEDLKTNWLNDPCWDIYNTEGFEQYAEQLRQFQADQEAEWIAKHELAEAKIDATAEDLGLKGLYRLICKLEEIQEIHKKAIYLLAEGESYKAYRVLTGIPEE